MPARALFISTAVPWQKSDAVEIIEMIEESESFNLGIELMKKALEILALPPDEQAAYLLKGGYGDCADELALEFDDAYQIIKRYFGKQRLPTEAEHLLESIHSQLQSMSGPQNSRFWTTAALEKMPEWASIRALALRARQTFHD